MDGSAESHDRTSIERLYEERLSRTLDAVALRQPDRVPIYMPAGYLLAEYGGISNQRLQDDVEKYQELIEKFACEFGPDIIGPPPMRPEVSKVVGDRMTKWPGVGLPESGSFQFAEAEFMKADDYEAFLRDPTDWILRTYVPRAFSNLESLAELPPLGMWADGYFNLRSLGLCDTPGIAAAVQVLNEAVQTAAKESRRVAESTRRLAARGFPPVFWAGSGLKAPFDFMSDTLRGMRGSMLDLLQRPDQLLEAEERVLAIELESAVTIARKTGLRGAFIPLHRGSDGFMSLPQFERFYWPQLKRLIVGLVDNDILPYVFYEGVWDKRLDYLTELPKGKTVGAFQKSEIFRVKETVGKTMCIVGGMPASLLKAGTLAEVRAFTRELCERVGEGGGYIMAPGVTELGGSKLELVRAWVEATREFGTY